jgi:hypothetical protein
MATRLRQGQEPLAQGQGGCEKIRACKAREGVN